MNPDLIIDIRTVVVIQVIVNLTIGLTLWLSMRGRYQFGMNYFITLFLSQFFVQILYILRGILPDFITIVLANVLLIASYNLGYLGYCSFFNRRVNWWFVYLPIIVILVVFTIYINDFRIRVISLGLVSSVQYAIQSVFVITVKEEAVKRSKPILLIGYTLILSLFLVRAIYMIINPNGIKGYFDPIWINSLTLILSIPSIILIALGVLVMISDRLMEVNRELATRDWLTHIFNRGTFIDLANRELSRAERYNHETSLVMIDIDRFKVVNDTYGHPIGDEALIHLVHILKDSLRMQDLYGRYGGEEFVILLAETSSEEAFQIAERIRKQIANTPLLTHNLTIKLTVSIGVATAHGGSRPSLNALISAADTAMYQAKTAGRNCTRILNLSAIQSDAPVVV
ncbi:GGDEF domain-containing protein [Leptolinea tardivitalis]|uniref:GGDEF domain-containing protein n=1 Tax=Leptolinea tardivitalis TaxID=229920 RepID=A0A0P6WW86_9CHLR|nr:GGDEF domain-containing protein [Leptolinea tardivitalis]KPL70288.1 hypothetical protein ADM99_14070 [Leptolinea tardivitalis]GAP21843.1 protein containing diguanylate cyclase (GGDEF) domain [Leptolinea tardivitalis]